MRKKSIKEYITESQDNGNFYFSILFIFLLPAIYFVVAGCDWPLWSCVPEKYVFLFLNGDALLYDIGLSYIGGFIFYLLVDYLPLKRRIRADTRNYIHDVQQYMFEMHLAILTDKDDPNLFYKKLYSLPKEPMVLYKREKWQDVITILYENYRWIEGSYRIYRQYVGLNMKTYEQNIQENVNKHKMKLEECQKNYRECANSLTDRLGIKWHKKIIKKK